MISTMSVDAVYSICQEEFIKYGYRVKFPANTDPHKTYQWRYLEKLCKNLEQWDFDEGTARVFINSVAEYAKSKKLLHKGLSIFHQSNVLQICYNKVTKIQDNRTQRLETIQSIHNKLHVRCGSRPPLKVLSERGGLGCDYNIVKWYLNGDLNDLYLSVSEPCLKAITIVAQKDNEQRRMLPQDSKIFGIWVAVSEDYDFKRELKAILGSEWRSLCL